jgi:hypothetical protein
MNKLIYIISSLTLFAISQTTQAQQCNTTSIVSSNSTVQFVINHQAGTVIDARTGLEWSLCSTGQIWQNGNCTGAPTHFSDYATALKEVTTVKVDNAQWQDYRLPNIKELGSIVERSCTSPAIDLTVFNGTLNAVYYSSTPDNQGNPLLGVKIIDFTNGTEFVPDVSKFRYVRLVRSINN